MARGPLIEMYVNTEKLRGDLNQLIHVLERADEAMEETHRRAVVWIGQRSLANLRRTAIRRERDDRNEGETLEDLVVNLAASSWDAAGFQYLDPDKVDAIGGRAADYYRVIEGRRGNDIGSWYWVDRTRTRPLYMRFFGSPSAPTPGERTMAGIGGGEAMRKYGDGGFVRFKRPIPAYHYADQAFQTFRQAHLYQKWAYEELRRVGIPVTLGR